MLRNIAQRCLLARVSVVARNENGSLVKIFCTSTSDDGDGAWQSATGPLASWPGICPTTTNVAHPAFNHALLDAAQSLWREHDGDRSWTSVLRPCRGRHPVRTRGCGSQLYPTRPDRSNRGWKQTSRFVGSVTDRMNKPARGSARKFVLCIVIPDTSDTGTEAQQMRNHLESFRIGLHLLRHAMLPMAAP